METAHSYKVKATSTMLRSGLVRIEGIEPSISFSAPLEFRGLPGHWTPEHFFVTAVASCYVSTFSGMADASRLEFLSLDLEAEGILEKKQEGWRFSKVVLRPQVKITREEDREPALRLLQKAKKGCLVAASLYCPVETSPEIRIEEELLRAKDAEIPAAATK